MEHGGRVPVLSTLIGIHKQNLEALSKGGLGLDVYFYGMTTGVCIEFTASLLCIEIDVKEDTCRCTSIYRYSD